MQGGMSMEVRTKGGVFFNCFLFIVLSLLPPFPSVFSSFLLTFPPSH